MPSLTLDLLDEVDQKLTDIAKQNGITWQATAYRELDLFRTAARGWVNRPATSEL